jgi:hypothetical protein
MRPLGPPSNALNKMKKRFKNHGLFDFPMKTAAGVSLRCLNLKRPVAIFGHTGGQIIP